MLNGEQISRNYQQACELAGELARRHLKGRGHAASDPLLWEELAQSAAGSEQMISLLQETPFSKEAYTPVLAEALEETRRLFFPDTAKGRFLSLDAHPGLELAEPASEEPTSEALPEPVDPDRILAENLSPDNLLYFRETLMAANAAWSERLQRLARQGTAEEAWRLADRRLTLMRRFYPQGMPPAQPEAEVREDLEAREIRHLYLQVYLGLQPAFPPHFLSRDPEKRCAELTRFLVREILESSPQDIMEANEETFFLRHHLQNVYRHFNYSLNRALRNAFPGEVPPWFNSRTAANYWETPQNRAEAVRWLVEERLGIDPAALHAANINRTDFAANGLSYMFNTFYNSVSRALQEAYPDRHPWEYGKVPLEFWDEQQSALAVQWVVGQKGWAVEDLPRMVAEGHFHRKTFSELGLATLFEKVFSRNLYRAVNCAWPGRFQPWEFGRVPGEYWQEPGQLFGAGRWIAEKEGFSEGDIVPAIRQKRFTLSHLKGYSIGAALRRFCGDSLEKIFAPLFWREARRVRQDEKLMRKAVRLKRRQGIRNVLDYLLHGFFVHDARLAEQRQRRQVERIEQRIRRRLRDEDRSDKSS